MISKQQMKAAQTQSIDNIQSPTSLLPAYLHRAHPSCIFTTCQMIGSQVCSQCGSNTIFMDMILSSACVYVLLKKTPLCCCRTCKLFPVSDILIISVTIMLFGHVFVAFGFLLSPITSLSEQPQQMFPSVLLTKRANPGCY